MLDQLPILFARGYISRRKIIVHLSPCRLLFLRTRRGTFISTARRQPVVSTWTFFFWSPLNLHFQDELVLGTPPPFRGSPSNIFLFCCSNARASRFAARACRDAVYRWGIATSRPDRFRIPRWQAFLRTFITSRGWHTAEDPAASHTVATGTVGCNHVLGL